MVEETPLKAQGARFLVRPIFSSFIFLRSRGEHIFIIEMIDIIPGPSKEHLEVVWGSPDTWMIPRTIITSDVFPGPGSTSLAAGHGSGSHRQRFDGEVPPWRQGAPRPAGVGSLVAFV